MWRKKSQRLTDYFVELSAAFSKLAREELTFGLLGAGYHFPFGSVGVEKQNIVVAATWAVAQFILKKMG